MAKWTKHNCINAALGHKTRMSFASQHWSAYTTASRNGWLAEACAHMPKRVDTGPYKWTDERIEQVVGKYENFSAFRDAEKSLFTLLCTLGRLEEFTAHLHRDRKENGYWTKDRCAEAAEQCGTRSDFIKQFPAASDAAYRNGWINDICGHMEIAGSAMSRAVYVIKAIGKNEIYVGLSANAKRRYRGHVVNPMPHILPLVSAPHRFRIVASYRPVREAIDLERRLIAHFQRKGWAVVNIREGGEAGANPRKWTMQALRDVASQCATRGDLFRSHCGAYDAAHQRGVLDQIFADHDNRGYGDGPIRDWDETRLRSVADQCESIRDFKKRFPKEAQAAYRRGLLGSLFAHRRNSGYAGRGPVWTMEAVAAEARHCVTRAEFKEKHFRAFRAAQRRGWLDTIFADRANGGYIRPDKARQEG